MSNGSEAFRVDSLLLAERDELEIRVNVEMMSLKQGAPYIIMNAMGEAVRDHLKEKPEIVSKILGDLDLHLKAEVERLVKVEVERRVFELIGKMEVDTLVKLASIGAAKELGRTIAK